MRVYFDYNATTPLAPEVIDAVARASRDIFGNASSVHHFGQQAKAAMDDAAIESLVLDRDEVVGFVPGFVDESQLFPTPTPAALRTPTAPFASARASDSASSSSGFPIGRAAAILGLVVLGAYAPGAVAIIIGQIRS